MSCLFFLEYSILQYVVFKVRVAAPSFSTAAAPFVSAYNRASYFLTVPNTNGDGEIRTLDPLLARQVLSQLSYTPIDNLAPTCSPMPSPA